MKSLRIIAVLEADLEKTPLGTPSRLADALEGRAVLRRTVERVQAAKRVFRTVVACPTYQLAEVNRLINGTRAAVVGLDGGPPPWRGLVQTARKWSLDGWRGGIGGATVFDEYTDCRILAGILAVQDGDAVLSIPPASPFFDAGMADAMIELLETDENDSRLVFTQVPPGLAGILLKSDLVRELADKRIPVGWLFTYKPDAPRKDLVFESCCLPAPVELRHAVGRLIVDTKRSFELASALLASVPEADSVSIGRWLQRKEQESVSLVPREVEIELTTEDPYPDTVLRPRGSRVGKRGPIEPGFVEQVAIELAPMDDSLVVLGGFGDPLLHPQLGAVLEALRPGNESRPGVYGIAVRTTGMILDDAAIETLMAFDVDVVEVLLDAWTPETYARLHSPRDPDRADLGRVTAGMDKLEKARIAAGRIRPLVVPSFCKARENVDELDEFHDGWLRRLGTVCIDGFSHFARQIEDYSVICMAPSSRSSCRRIRSRMLVLADGCVALCGMDFQGRFSPGQIPAAADRRNDGINRLDQRSPAWTGEIWRGELLENVRGAHRRGSFNPTPLCAACDDWHRP
jgi:hypothetical protein